MPYCTYDQVSRLNTDTQRQLLQHGDALERVWAAWALGVTIGTQSMPDLLISLQESPEPGTRRHLLVVLAGLGEQSVLRILAQDDPDHIVRATACQYLIRISQPTDISIQKFVQERVLHDSSGIVRLGILSEAPLKSPAIRFDDLTELIHDPDPEVRQAVTKRLLATVELNQLFPGVLEEHIPYEDDSDLRQRLLMLCIEAGGAARLLALSTTLAPERTLEILRLLVEAKAQFNWEQLSPLSLSKNPHYDACLVQLLQPTNIIPALPWLLYGIARAATWPKPQDRPEEFKLAYAVRTHTWHAKKLGSAQDVMIGK
jgi:HEAT repeat protein